MQRKVKHEPRFGFYQLPPDIVLVKKDADVGKGQERQRSAHLEDTSLTLRLLDG